MSYYNLCDIGSQHSNISKGKGGVHITDFPKTVGPSVLTDRNAVGPTISKYISNPNVRQ